jgi:broad specificity phosphatase PhoE
MRNNASTSLIVVRHGETEWTEAKRIHGWLDSRLSAKGRVQAVQTARELEIERIERIYSSPLGRAMETATVIASASGQSPIPLPELRELGFGWLEGKCLPYLSPDFSGPVLLRPIVKAVLSATGENETVFQERVEAGLDILVSRHPNSRIALVTHWIVLSQIAMSLLNEGNGNWRDYGGWKACGISEFKLDGGNWKVERWNDAAHLSESLG